MTCACGCVVELDPSGALRSTSKCAAHQAMRQAPSSLGEAYYTSLGILVDGELAETKHVQEITEALGNLPNVEKTGFALELGCGVSPYVDWIVGQGFYYAGLDLSPWAVAWMNFRDDGSAFLGSLDSGPFEAGDVELILAAHFFEHLADAPQAIVDAAALLIPGGQLWIVSPDDSDLCNPDHLWFFNEASLRACLERAGLVVEKLTSFRRIPRERFLYARARKPGP